MDELTEKEMEQILANLRVGIARIETGGISNPYADTAGDKNKDGKPDSSATGKYQFTKEWLSKTGSLQGIKEFAKSSGVFGEVNSMTDFASQPELQEAYFTYYAKKVLIPQAIKTSTKNPLNLSLDEIASQFHFQSPKVAKDSIQSGKLVKETKTNASGYKYIDLYRKGLSDAGLKPISAYEVVKQKEQSLIDQGKDVKLSDSEKKIKENYKKIKEEFAKKDKAISDLDTDQSVKEKLRAKLFQEAVDNGTVDIANDYIESQNKAKEQKINEYKELLSVVEKLRVNEIKDKNGNIKFGKSAVFPNISHGDILQFNKIAKRHNIKTLKGTKNAYLFSDVEKVVTSLHEELTGEKITLNPGDEKGNVETDIGFFERIFGYNTGPGKETKISFKNIKKPDLKKRALIDPKNYIKKSLSDIHDTKTEETTTTTKTTTSTENTNTSEEVKDSAGTNTKTDEVPPEAIDENSAEQYFQRQLGLASTTEDDFNIGETKGELPIDAITGLALGLIGDEQAKKANIPLRTEEVSDAVKMFTAELAKRSKEGLPVEVEAKMKNDMAEATQAALSNLTNASAGNRATVLGNLGSIDANNKKGLVAIQMADYEAKEKAFAQYGQALMYENDFNANRDIANHGIKYREAKENQANGRALATAGFSKMIDDIKYQKENGPGSANDQYRSLLMQKMFGFDPKMKDDGTGTVKGTKSYFDKKKGLASENLTKTKELYQKFGTLNPEQKKTLGLLTDQTSDSNKIEGMMNFLLENPEQDLSKISMDNLDIASKNNDFSYLALDRDKALSDTQKETPLKPNEIMLSENDIANAESGLYDPSNPMIPLNSENEQETNKLDSTGNSYNAQFASMNEHFNNQ